MLLPWRYFILFYGWVIFHCIYAPRLLYPSAWQWMFKFKLLYLFLLTIHLISLVSECPTLNSIAPFTWPVLLPFWWSSFSFQRSLYFVGYGDRASPLTHSLPLPWFPMVLLSYSQHSPCSMTSFPNICLHLPVKLGHVLFSPCAFTQHLLGCPKARLCFP